MPETALHLQLRSKCALIHSSWPQSRCSLARPCRHEGRQLSRFAQLMCAFDDTQERRRTEASRKQVSTSHLAKTTDAQLQTQTRTTATARIDAQSAGATSQCTWKQPCSATCQLRQHDRHMLLAPRAAIACWPALASAGQELAKSGQGWPGFARNSQGNVNNYTLPVPNIKKNDGIFSNMILEVSGEYSYAQLCPRGFW